ncbi:MAG: hypothetical protein DRJ31_10890 [Candidatus Methanomethylicota archaeon]|uniref:HAD family phosphatase n=1 Tax=Thermoproteota archaeon TaxID=2056631 RepID=A0A497EK25_9CREN|nr:MAG: hypothetical protein DRJ31_10890 [Candidatus Verstraetearchaeota archaeon]
MPRKFAAIAVDLAGVLTADGLREVQNRLEGRYANFSETFRKHWYKCAKGSITTAEMWSSVFRNYGTEIDSDAARMLDEEAVLNHRVNQRVLRMLERSRKKGRKTFLVTNTAYEYLNEIERRHHLRFGELFTGIIAPYLTGRMKPDERVFSMLIDECGVEPEEILYLDDSQKNVETARNLGIDARVYRYLG